MSAIRKYARLPAILLTVSLVLASCSTLSQKAADTTTTVTPGGGTYHLGKFMTVTVPAGSVPTDTKLRLTPPRGVSGQGAAPISAKFKSVGFDLSMTDSNGKTVEPAASKPLDVKIQLSGDYLPKGSSATQALMYTPSGQGGWQLALPSVVQNGVLSATLTHLSPKTIMYLDASGMRQLLQTEASNAQAPGGNCGKEVTTPTTGKVMFGAGNKGWADGGDTPALPCLGIANNLPQLTVTNRANYILSVSASARVKVAASGGDLDDGASAFIASKIFPDPIVQTYLARGAVAQAQFGTNNLPGKVRLSADPNMVAAESLWKTLKLAVQLITGDTSDTALKLAKALLDVQDFQKCIQASNKLPQSKSGSEVADSVAEVVIGTCGETLVESLAEAQKAAIGALSASALAGRLKTLFTVVGAIKDSIELAATQIEHDRIGGDIDVALQIAEPPCPTKADIARLYNDYMRARFPQYPLTSVTTRDNVVCGSGWVLAIVDLTFDYAGSPQATQDVPLLRWQQGKWTVVASGTDPQDKRKVYCSQLTGPVRQALYCP